VLLSGDHPEITAAMGDALAVDEAVGGCTPDDKADWLRERPLAAFVGDGLNDGPALAVAPVSLAMHTGAASSLWLADGLVTQPALRPIVAAVAGARATRDVVRGNLRRALVYNALAITAAVLGWINPLAAAVLMPLSSAWIIWGALSVPRRMARMEAKWTSC
jgi:P-type E1-E2 ATPase